MDPHWTDDGFLNASPRSPVLIYCAFWQWFNDNLSIEERILIDIGDNSAWPNRQGVGDDEIRDALIFVLRAIEGMNVIHDNITATQCFRKLITKVHPDRYARGGRRVQSSIHITHQLYAQVYYIDVWQLLKTVTQWMRSQCQECLSLDSRRQDQ